MKYHFITVGGFKSEIEFKAFIIPYIRTTWKESGIAGYATANCDPSHSWLLKQMAIFCPRKFL